MRTYLKAEANRRQDRVRDGESKQREESRDRETRLQRRGNEAENGEGLATREREIGESENRFQFFSPNVAILIF